MFQMIVITILIGLLLASVYKFYRIIHIEQSLEVLADIKKNTENIHYLRERIDHIQDILEKRGVL